MLGTSVAEYAFIRVCIFILRCVAPLSILYCVAITIHPALILRMRPAIELWLAAEALFCTCLFLPYRWYLQHAATHPPSGSVEERRKLVDCVKAEMADPEQYIRGWFKGANIEDIGRQDMKEWLTWAFFNRRWEEGKDGGEIEGYMLEIESMLCKDFQPGKGAAKSLRLTIDPVDMHHRSLLWYFVSSSNLSLLYLLTGHRISVRRSCRFPGIREASAARLILPPPLFYQLLYALSLSPCRSRNTPSFSS